MRASFACILIIVIWVVTFLGSIMLNIVLLQDFTRTTRALTELSTPAPALPQTGSWIGFNVDVGNIKGRTEYTLTVDNQQWYSYKPKGK